jgi:hypothetical protein
MAGSSWPTGSLKRVNTRAALSERPRLDPVESTQLSWTPGTCFRGCPHARNPRCLPRAGIGLPQCPTPPSPESLAGIERGRLARHACQALPIQSHALSSLARRGGPHGGTCAPGASAFQMLSEDDQRRPGASVPPARKALSPGPF